MDRPRRRRGCLIALAIAAILTIAFWLLLPRVICLVANASLPHELGPQATLLALEPAAHRLHSAPIVLQVDPTLMRRIASEASGRWIPPGVIRHGLGAVGTLRGEGNIAVPWQVVAINEVSPPRLSVSLTPEQADALLASNGSTGKLAGMDVRPRLTSVELSALPDDGLTRHFRIEASGALRLSSGTLSLTIPIHRLSSEVTVSFTSAESGWEPIIHLHIDVLEAPLPPIPGVDSGTWRRMLGAWVEDRIADQLASRTLPAWFPTDLRLSMVVR